MRIASATRTHIPLAATAYTVVRKTGQRGIEYDDPGLAARAFFLARNEDRPFVLRHRGAATIVVAVAKSGRKQITADCAGDEFFRAAFEAVASVESRAET